MDASTAKFRYHGTGGSLFGLMLGNALLTIITLGIYSFWARNSVRQFHYSHTEADGDRFTYHGTGGELLRGYLKALGIMFVLAMGFGVLSAVLAPGRSQVAQVIVVIALYVAIFMLSLVAINGARRYRMSRSSWRGIRFSFHGKAEDFVPMMLRGTLLSIVTLGFYSPEFQNQRRAFLVTNARFGSEPFLYDGEGRALFGEWVKALLLTIPTLGFSWIWYVAFQHRYFWSHTAMRGARFQSTVTGGDLLSLSLTNVLLVFLTLGIGAPWAMTRAHQFWTERLSLHGTVEWATIQQRAQAADATAEGLADSFDIDVGIGM
ncbi:MAG TPA: YjgN family protein [Gemmatimonadaceae bacterium]|nr:YjgN family protein [Gemmatimonadaceae bacterium]